MEKINPKEQKEIPNWISQNSNFLSVYLLFRSMKPLVLLFFGSCLLYLYVFFKNRKHIEQVESDFMIEKLHQGEIKETWLEKITKHVGEEVDDKVELFVHITLHSG